MMVVCRFTLVLSRWSKKQVIFHFTFSYCLKPQLVILTANRTYLQTSFTQHCHSVRSSRSRGQQSLLNRTFMLELTSNQIDCVLAPAAESSSKIICSMNATSESLNCYSNQTGRFPIKYNRVNLNMFVLYDSETNRQWPI